MPRRMTPRCSTSWLGDLAHQRGLAAALLLAPGAVQIYYGDESARSFIPSGSDPYQARAVR